MASPRLSLLLLTLALYICTVLSDGPVAVVISNRVHHSSIRVSCQREGEIFVAPGRTHGWVVRDTSSEFLCMAFMTNTNNFVAWNAYQASRDAGHKIVYWLAYEDGLHFGYDNTTWKRGVEWDFE